jgi:hypothetical protein
VIILKARPTEAQAEAGNYKMKRRSFRGLQISIENPAGSVREGTDRGGKKWRTKMLFDYGYIRRTEGADGDHVDCYIGPDEEAPHVYVVHQRKAGDWKAYDEDKAMLGFRTKAEAVRAYLAHYDDPRFLGPVTRLPFEEFKDKALATFDDPGMVKARPAGMLLLRAHVKAHVRKGPDGRAVPVRAYETRRQARPSPTDTEQFKRWFAGSKVVDRAGRPLKVYHGTTHDIGGGVLRPGRQAADSGIFFTSDAAIASGVYARGRAEPNDDGIRAALAGMSDAEIEALAAKLRARWRRFDFYPEDYGDGVSYADQLADYARDTYDEFEGHGQPIDWLAAELGVPAKAPASGSNVMPVYLNLRNPMIVDGSRESFDPEQQAQWLQRARRGGHDGLIIRNYDDGGFGAPGSYSSAGRHTVYVAFRPEQVKSAVGNAGSFDPNDPDITKALAWKVSLCKAHGQGRPTVCLDFDGVIHSYVSGWRGETEAPDPPVPGVGEAIAELRRRCRVVVLSARCASAAGRRAVAAYLDAHGIAVDEVCTHKPPAAVYVDDLGYRFDGDWAQALPAVLDLAGA